MKPAVDATTHKTMGPSVPKCLIRSPHPADLLTVPACTDCNRDFSRDEAYFRLVIVGLLWHTAEAESLFDGSMSRSELWPQSPHLGWPAAPA